MDRVIKVAIVCALIVVLLAVAWFTLYPALFGKGCVADGGRSCGSPAIPSTR